MSSMGIQGLAIPLLLPITLLAVFFVLRAQRAQTTRRLIDEKTQERFTEAITERKDADLRAQLLRDIAIEATDSPSFEAMIQTVLDKMCNYLNWPLGHAYIWNAKHEELESMRIWHFGDNEERYLEFRQVSEVMEFEANMSLPGKVIELKQPVFVQDVATSPDFLRNKALASLDLHAGIFIPILVKERVAAVLEFFSSHHIPEDKRFIEFSETLSAQLSRVIERKEAEKALEESNSLNKAVLSSASHIIIATDKQGIILVFNRTAELSLGYDTTEVVGKHTPLIWHDRNEIAQCAETLSQEWGFPVQAGLEVFTRPLILKHHESSEWTFIRKDGSRFPGHQTSTPLWNKEGDVVGYLNIIENITERKKQDMALKASEETFRSAMEHASIGMALAEPSGRWLKVNQALCNLLGYSKSELLSTDFQSITHPGDLAADLDYVKQMLEGMLQTYQMEKRYLHKDGRIIWVLLNVSIVHTSDGHPHYLIVQIQDITSRKEIERIKDEFISIVSHELRTPLTSIRGSLGLVAGIMASDLSDQAQQLIDIAYKNSERLILLINDILDIDKIACGHMPFDIKDENVAALLQQAVETNRAYGEKFNVYFELAPIADTLTIRVDAARLIQVLTNLLSNAAKFSPEGQKVDIAAYCSEGTVRIAIKDYGAGIKEEFRTRIFGKFSQADSSIAREKGGTGLGLHISKQIVEHMGGHISFDTEVGQGTTFWIEFSEANNASLS